MRRHLWNFGLLWFLTHHTLSFLTPYTAQQRRAELMRDHPGLQAELADLNGATPTLNQDNLNNFGLEFFPIDRDVILTESTLEASWWPDVLKDQYDDFSKLSNAVQKYIKEGATIWRMIWTDTSACDLGGWMTFLDDMNERWDQWAGLEIILTPLDYTAFTDAEYLLHVEPVFKEGSGVQFVFEFDYEFGIVFILSLAGLEKVGIYSDILAATWSKFDSYVADQLSLGRRWGTRTPLRVVDLGTDLNVHNNDLGSQPRLPSEIIGEFETVFDLQFSQWRFALSKERQQMVLFAIAGSPTKKGMMNFASRYPNLIDRRAVGAMNIIDLGDFRLATGIQRRFVIEVEFIPHSDKGRLGPIQMPKPPQAFSLALPSASLKIPPPRPTKPKPSIPARTSSITTRKQGPSVPPKPSRLQTIN